MQTHSFDKNLRKKVKNSSKNILTSFLVRTASESWSKFTIIVFKEFTVIIFISQQSVFK